MSKTSGTELSLLVYSIDAVISPEIFTLSCDGTASVFNKVGSILIISSIGNLVGGIATSSFIFIFSVFEQMFFVVFIVVNFCWFSDKSSILETALISTTSFTSAKAFPDIL